MEWKTLAKDEARKRVAEWQTARSRSLAEGTVPEIPRADSLNEAYSALRQDLCQRYQTISDELDAAPTQAARNYRVDLDFGLYLYDRLTELGFSERMASTDPVWFYLSVAVVPDLVYRRYGNEIHVDRYFAKKRRIWLKSLWWYIHLCLQTTDNQPDLDRTREALMHNTTDTILQIVDRAGPGGYRVEVTRELMRRYADQAQSDASGLLLRRLMVLHVARVRLMEPALCEGGVAGYIDSLFAYYDE